MSSCLRNPFLDVLGLLHDLPVKAYGKKEELNIIETHDNGVSKNIFTVTDKPL